MYRLDTPYPHQARAIALQEMPNLLRALGVALAAAQSDPALLELVVSFANSIERFLDIFGRWRESERLLLSVKNTISGVSGGSAHFMYLRSQAEEFRKRGYLEKAIRTLQELSNSSEGVLKALVLLDLGRCFLNASQAHQAIETYQEALQIYRNNSPLSLHDQGMMATCHAELADVLQSIGQYKDAEQQYYLAYEIFKETKDLEGQASVTGNLGVLVRAQGDLDKAVSIFQESRKIYHDLGKPREEVVDIINLADIFAVQQDWKQSEQYYREGLKILEKMNDLPRIATIYIRLGIIAGQNKRFDVAEQWYLQAQEINDKLARSDPTALGNLAELYRVQTRLGEAEQYALRALAIVETLDLSAEPWKYYSILSQIAAAKGDTAAARDWRRKEQESYAAYAGAAHKLPSWAPDFINAVAAAAQGSQEAQEAVNQLLLQLDKAGWTNLTAAVRSILSGEFDKDVLFENLDRQDAYIVRAILQQLSGEAPPAPSSPAQQTGRTAPEPEPTQQNLNDFLNSLLIGVVAVATNQAPPEVGVQLHAVTRALAGDPDMPPELQALGRVLNGILSGERNPDLSLLPPELAGAVREVLGQIGELN